MCFGPSLNPAAGAAYGGAGGMYYPQQPARPPNGSMLGGPFGFGGLGFGGALGGSPWLPFLFNLFSSYGAPPQQPQPAQPAQPTQPGTNVMPAAAPAMTAPQGVTFGGDPAAPAAPMAHGSDPAMPSAQPGNVAPTGALSGPLSTPVGAPLAGTTANPAPPSLGGTFGSLSRNSFAGPWAGVLGT